MESLISTTAITILIMAMKREIDEQLLQWKQSPRRKPLILDGARQVGKTYALRHFGQAAYDNTVYLNFEREAALSVYFQESISPKHIIEKLALHTRTAIQPGSTLIIFDEVQECPEALNSIKYFCEEANEYHLAAAGSLLGIKTKNVKGFPVGKVNFLHLFPLTFNEFLDALGEEKLREYIASHEIIPFDEPLHQQLLLLLKKYYYVGGMPEAVSHFVQTQDYQVVREVHYEILEAYERDFGKHAPVDQIMKIMTVWKQVHNQLAKENKKFIFSHLKKSARGRDYESAIEWLVSAGLIYKCTHVTVPKLPLSGYADMQIFKIYPLDVGLLGAQNGLTPEVIVKENTLFSEYKGALTEAYVAQTLKASSGEDVYYWSSSGTAEVDFLLTSKQAVYPLEVKANVSNKKKSLIVYAAKYKPTLLLRSTQMNLKWDGHLLNIPLYMISQIHALLAISNPNT